MSIWAWLIVAWAIERVQLKLCAPTYVSKYCGLGMTDEVNARTAESPMAYKVLVPWVIGVAERVLPLLKTYRLTALYEPMKIVGMAGTLWMAAQAVGDMRALLIAAMMPITFYFDYWDWIPEMFALAAGLAGNLPMALVGGVACGMSRETAPLAALVYGLVTGDVVGALAIAAVTGATMGAVRLYVGRKRLYCDRFMWRVNWQDLRGLLRNRPVYLSEMGMTLLVTVLTLAVVITGRAGAAWVAPMAILITGWTMARAAETRVFGACLLWVVMLF